MDGDILLYRKEFYVLWNCGKLGNKIEDTVLVCIVTLDEGDTTIIRIFDSEAGEDTRAEDKLLEWLPNDPNVCDSNLINIEILTSHSPRFSFSKSFSEMKLAIEDQQKEVHVDFKIVHMYNVLRGEEEADENKNGIREMAAAHIRLGSVSGQDWQYLRQILRHKKGIDEREKTNRKVRKTLKRILRMEDLQISRHGSICQEGLLVPRHGSVSHDVLMSRTGSMTDATQTEFSDSSFEDY